MAGGAVVAGMDTGIGDGFNVAVTCGTPESGSNAFPVSATVELIFASGAFAGMLCAERGVLTLFEVTDDLFVRPSVIVAEAVRCGLFASTGEGKTSLPGTGVLELFVARANNARNESPFDDPLDAVFEERTSLLFGLEPISGM